MFNIIKKLSEIDVEIIEIITRGLAAITIIVCLGTMHMNTVAINDMRELSVEQGTFFPIIIEDGEIGKF